MRAAFVSVAVLASSLPSVSAVGQTPPTSGSTESELTIAAGNCLLEVRGKRYLSGPCEIEATRDSVLVRSSGRRTHFAVISFERGKVLGFWNGEEALGTAHLDLGEMTREGRCWVNQISRVCAWPRQVKRRISL
jgi:hypothetical protein